MSGNMEDMLLARCSDDESSTSGDEAEVLGSDQLIPAAAAIAAEVEAKRFIHVLMRYLENNDREVYAKAKAAIAFCFKLNKAGDPQYASLTDSMKPHLRSVVGEKNWKTAEAYYERIKEDYRRATSPEVVNYKRSIAEIASSHRTDNANFLRDVAQLGIPAAPDFIIYSMRERRMKEMKNTNERMINVGSLRYPKNKLSQMLVEAEQEATKSFVQGSKNSNAAAPTAAAKAGGSVSPPTKVPTIEKVERQENKGAATADRPPRSSDSPPTKRLRLNAEATYYTADLSLRNVHDDISPKCILTLAASNGWFDIKLLGRVENTCKDLKFDDDEIWKTLCCAKWPYLAKKGKTFTVDPKFKAIIAKVGGYRAWCRSMVKTVRTTTLSDENMHPLPPPSITYDDLTLLVDINTGDGNTIFTGAIEFKELEEEAQRPRKQSDQHLAEFPNCWSLCGYLPREDRLRFEKRLAENQAQENQLRSQRLLHDGSQQFFFDKPYPLKRGNVTLGTTARVLRPSGLYCVAGSRAFHVDNSGGGGPYHDFVCDLASTYIYDDGEGLAFQQNAKALEVQRRLGETPFAVKASPIVRSSWNGTTYVVGYSIEFLLIARDRELTFSTGTADYMGVSLLHILEHLKGDNFSA